jgi:hypothetical protein
MRISLFIIAFFALTGCRFLGGQRIYGNGSVTTKTESMDGITGVRVKGGLDVYITQGPGTSVKLEGDENLLEYIEVVKEGNIVEVSTREGYSLRPSKSLRVYVSAPILNEFYIDGSGDIRTQTPLKDSNSIRTEIHGSGDAYLDVDAPAVSASIAGSGTINLKGNTRTFSGSIAGSGDIKGFDLLSETTSVDIGGSGDAQVFASKQLNASITGAGDVQYKGNAAVRQSTHGSGSITKVQ